MLRFFIGKRIYEWLIEKEMGSMLK